MAQPSGRLSHLERLPGEERVDERQMRPPALFMALFLGCALLLSLANPALLESPDEPLLDGSWAAAYQEAFDESSLLLSPANTVWGVIEYTVLGQGRPGVLIGSEGWLYTREEFDFPTDHARAQATLDRNLDLIQGVERRLAREGISLVVALLPTKARVYPEHLGRYRLPEVPRQLYRSALLGLRDRGIPAADLHRALTGAKDRGQLFLRTDTHWTPLGASVAADTTAAAVRSTGEYEWLEETDFETTRGEPRQHRGDLTRYITLGPFYDELGPPDDRLVPATTSTEGAVGADLFAPVSIPVVLVGTSYSRDERWNFPGYLREALGSDVLVAAQEGRGPYEPMIDYLNGEAIRSSRPDVVVWEIPERYLGQTWPGGEEPQ